MGTGQRLDATGLHFYNARYYDSLLGRFVSADTLVPNPIASSNYNRYAYVRNNPLRFIDTNGHCDCILDLLLIGYDVYQIGAEGWTPVNTLALAADVILLFVPIGTGGGPAVRGGALAIEAAVRVPNAVRAGQFGIKIYQTIDGSEQEKQVGDSLSGQDDLEVKGNGDSEVRKVLGISRFDKAADYLIYNKKTDRWGIIESKGGDVDSALKQLENTMNALLEKQPSARGRTDLGIVMNNYQYEKITSEQGLAGYELRDGYLGWNDAATETWQFLEINGVRVKVVPAP